MVRIDLKGIAKVTAKGRVYWYAWRGGPRLSGEPGTPEFVASYKEAIEQHRTLDKKRFRFVIADYKASAEYKKLAESTRTQWGKWLDRIVEYFGELRIAQFDRPEKIRPVIRRWRSTAKRRGPSGGAIAATSSTPRKAHSAGGKEDQKQGSLTQSCDPTDQTRGIEQRRCLIKDLFHIEGHFEALFLKSSTRTGIGRAAYSCCLIEPATDLIQIHLDCCFS